MKRTSVKPRIKRNGMQQAFAAVLLMGMVAIAVAGPSGIVTWGESETALEQRKVQLARLTEERDTLKNRVDLLDPQHPDADYAGQLAKVKLNVMNHDEKLMMLPKP